VPSNEEKADPNLYCKNVQQYIAKHKQCVVTPHNLADHFLAAWGDTHQQYNVSNLLCNEIFNETGLRQSCVLIACEEFARLDKDKDGVISSYEYARILSLHKPNIANDLVSELANKLFAFVASDGYNYWTIQNFIAFFGAILSTKNKIYVISLLFHLCDINNDQIIQKKTLEQSLVSLQDVFGKTNNISDEDQDKVTSVVSKFPVSEIQQFLKILFNSDKEQLSFEEFSELLHRCDFKPVQDLIVWFLTHGLRLREANTSKLLERHQVSSDKRD